MKKRFKFLLLLPCFTFMFVLSNAQDPTFSQFYNKEMYYNPAFTGINPGLRVLVTDRELWTNVPGNYNTMSFAIDFYDVKFANGGLGAIVTRASKGEGFMTSTNTGIQYAKRIGITPDFIMQLGASATYNWNRLDFSGLHFPDEYDARFGNIYETEFQAPTGDGDIGKADFFDFSAGMVARFNIKMTPIKPLAINTLGVALHHLSQPDQSYLNNGDAKLPMRLTLHWYSMFRVGFGGFRYNGHMLVAPGVLFENQAEAENMFSKDEAGYKTLNFGINGYIPVKLSFISQINLGVWARKQYYKTEDIDLSGLGGGAKKFDAVIWQIGYHKMDRHGKRLYRVNYSYDMTVSTAGLATGGTHEITLIIELHDLALPGRSKRWGYIKNPADLFFHR